MKDQVDTLIKLGLPAAAINRTQGAGERRAVSARIRARQLKLLYLSPEQESRMRPGGCPFVTSNGSRRPPTTPSRWRTRLALSHQCVGRNEQTPTLPELRSPRDGHGNTHSVPAKNGVRAVPATLCDLVPAYGEKCGLATETRPGSAAWRVDYQQIRKFAQLYPPSGGRAVCENHHPPAPCGRVGRGSVRGGPPLRELLATLPKGRLKR